LLTTRLGQQHPVKGISVNPRQAAGLYCVGMGYIERLHLHSANHLQDEYHRLRVEAQIA